MFRKKNLLRTSVLLVENMKLHLVARTRDQELERGLEEKDNQKK